MFQRYKTYVDSKVNTPTLQKAVQTEIKMADMDENMMADGNGIAHDNGDDETKMAYQTEIKKPEVKSNPIEEEIDKKLEPLRKVMSSYKDLYEAGEMMPADIYENFYYENISTKEDSIEYMDLVATKIGDMMVQYKLPELYKKHLDLSTYETWVAQPDTEVSITRNLTNISCHSKHLVLRMIELGYIEWYVQQILNSQKFLENYTDEYGIGEVMRSAVCTLTNCATQVPNHPLYREQHLAQVLQPYLSSKKMSIKTMAYMLLSSIISEDENSKLEDSDCIPFMVEGVHKAVHNKTRIFVIKGESNFMIPELVECLNRIAANDSNKIKLVEAGLLPDLLLSMQEGSVEEQEMAAQLTWTLCFSDSAKEKVMSEPGYIEQLEKLRSSDNKLVKKAANGALWKIQGEQSHTEQRLKTPDIDQEKHIFISYQWDNQDVILQINNRLKADGYRTWIDVEQMGGSTLDAMARAVEDAYLVLVSASEKYKLSPNCRTEAEYTFQTKKPIVPLMMQRHYKPDGWLGMLMGAKLYVNFDGKYEFEEAYKMLIKEMSPYLMAAARKESSGDGTKVVPQAATKFYNSPPALKPVPPREPAATSWSHKQVLDWAHKYKLTELNLKFQHLLDNMDGPHLVDLALMEKKIPDTFYKLAREEHELDALQYLRLTRALADIRQNLL